MNALAYLLLLAGGLSAAAANSSAQPGAAPRQERYVYEIPTRASASVVLRAVESHLAQRGDHTVIAVVAHGSGVEAMVSGAAAPDGMPYARDIEHLAKRGVDFAVCGASLKLLGIEPSRVIAQGRIVPGGNAEIDRLVRAGYLRLN